LQINDRAKLECAALNMSPCRFKRGKAVVTAGDASSINVWMLREGDLSAQVLATTKPKVQTVSVISTAGYIVGTSFAIHGEAEPVTIKVESSTCDVYTVAWEPFWRGLPPRVQKGLRKTSLSLHERHCVLASSCPLPFKLHDRDENLEESDYSLAWADLANTAKRYAELPPDHDTHPLQQTAALRQFLKSSVLSATKQQFAMIGTTISKGDRTNAKGYREEVDKAMKKVDNARCGDCTVARPIQTQLEVRAPPDFCKERLKAELLAAMDKDPSLIQQRLMFQAVHDPDKDDLDLWIKRYAMDPRVRTSQYVQAVLRKYCHVISTTSACQRKAPTSSLQGAAGLRPKSAVR